MTREISLGDAPAQAYVLAEGRLLIAPRDGRTLLEADITGNGMFLRKMEPNEMGANVSLNKVEASVRTATSSGCRFDIVRRIIIGRSWTWRRDNYWDFDHRAIKIELDVQLTSGDRGRCVWNAPFRSRHWTIENLQGQAITTGRPGFVNVAVPENRNPYAFIRAIALHVQNAARYRVCRPEMVPGDNWAIIVQNSRNGGTACEALRQSPTAQQATSAGRVFLQVPIFGSNPRCQQTTFFSIACVTETRARACTNTRSATIIPPVETFKLQERAISGMGECLLPMVD